MRTIQGVKAAVKRLRRRERGVDRQDDPQGAPDAPRVDRPNILLVMTDQQRFDAVGAGGWTHTPSMDRIAREGVTFTGAYTNSPVCIPARVSLATGRYPHNLGLWKNGTYTLNPETPTWMAGIRDASYRTSVFGKTHLHPHRGDLRDRIGLMQAYGLDDVDEIAGPRATAKCDSNLTDEWRRAGVYDAYVTDIKERLRTKPWVARPSPLPLDLYPDVYVGQKAASYLRAYDRNQPWFCWVSFSGPHEPWDAPEPYATKYAPEDMPAPIRPVPTDTARPRGRLDAVLAKDRFPFEPGDVERLRANYAGNVSLIDDQIGNLISIIEERGELDRTVIALVSDHGEMNGDYGLVYKEVFLNGATRIPFMVRTPATAAGVGGARVTTPVELMDIGATLAELAGVTLEGSTYARSVVPVLEDQTRAHREEAVSEIRGEIMLATEEWKCALNRDGRLYLLFDLAGDPMETRNLAGDPGAAEIERELQIRTLGRLVSTLR